MERQKFESIVEEKKQEQIGNIPTYMMEEYNQNITKPEDFFSWKEISIDSFRAFYRINKYDQDYINKMVPKVNFEKRKEEILDGIDIKDVSTPTELVSVISKYMKDLMKYDIIEAIPQVFRAGESLVLEWEMEDNQEWAIDSAISIIKSFLNPNEEELTRFRELYKWMKARDITKHLYQTIYTNLDQKESIVMGEREYQLFKNKLDKLLNMDNLSPKEQISISMKLGDIDLKFLDKLKKWLFPAEHSSKDFKSDFWKMISRESLENRDKFIDNFHIFLRDFIVDDILAKNGEYELADKLYISKIWVCRDYSVIIKKIYQELAPRLFPNSEVLYIIDYGKNHAYNVLVFENKQWQIEYKYFDLTKYINGGELFIPEEDIKKEWIPSKDEVFVRNELEDLKTDIIS